jgi:hypothetical protein
MVSDCMGVPRWRVTKCVRGLAGLLRQAAQHSGLLAADDAPSADGVISEAAASAISCCSTGY